MPRPEPIQLPAPPPDTVVIERTTEVPIELTVERTLCLATGENGTVMATPEGVEVIALDALGGVYAADAEWFNNDSEIEHADYPYEKVGEQISPNCTTITRVGEWLGVPLFAESAAAGEDPDPDDLRARDPGDAGSRTNCRRECAADLRTRACDAYQQTAETLHTWCGLLLGHYGPTERVTTSCLVCLESVPAFVRRFARVRAPAASSRPRNGSGGAGDGSASRRSARPPSAGPRARRVGPAARLPRRSPRRYRNLILPRTPTECRAPPSPLSRRVPSRRSPTPAPRS